MEFTAISRLDKGKLVVEINAPEADETTQYAYYLCEQSRGVLVKRMYISKSTFSFDLPDSGQYFVRAYVRHWPNGKEADPVITAQYTNKVTFYPTKSLTYEQLEGERFLSPNGMIYDILWNGVHYEFYIFNRPNSSSAVIFGSGALRPAQLPHFNRISWSTSIQETTIFYSDPTLYRFDPSGQSEEFVAGWGYGTNDRWYLEEIAVLLTKILDRLNIPTSNTLFYGSSAGGFMSMVLAAMLRSRATVINPQFTIENYVKRSVDLMKRVCLKKGESLLPERTHVSAVFAQQSYFPLLHILQNVQSKLDVTAQLSPFLAELNEMSLPCTERLTVDLYSEPGGHGAMPAHELCLRHIAEDLARPLPEGDVPGEDSLLYRVAQGEFDPPEPLPVTWSGKEEEKLHVIITVDTERAPSMVECDFGGAGNCGVNYIMDQLEQRGMRCVFFTNIYEHTNCPAGYMEGLLKRISQRGHEVALHAHRNTGFDFYQKSIYESTYQEQYKILGYGTDYIQKHTGKRSISYRGGAYNCNEATFRVLSDLGYRVDSSCFYKAPDNGSCRPHHFRSLNQTTEIGSLIEFPVVMVSNRSGSIRKFDLNALDTKDLIALTENMKERKSFTSVQLMFHSFSFLDRSGQPGQTPDPSFSVKDVYGIDRRLTKRFEDFLDYLKNDPGIEVVTFEEYVKKGLPLPPAWGDGVFHTGSDSSRKAAQEFSGVRVNARHALPDTCPGDDKVKLWCDFDSCGLPKPASYFPDSQVESVAQDIMNGKLWVSRVIEPMPYSLDTLDFNVQWSKAPQTFQLYLQALNPIQALTQAFEATRDSAYLEFAARFLQCWETYSSNPTLTRSNQYAFGDHAVALRAENLMYFGQVCSKVGIWSDQLYRHLYQLLVKHGELLCNDAHYTKRHNHGVMQDQALIHLGFVLGRRDWVEHAKERLLQQEQFAFNAECVHTENSPGYADLVSKLFANIGQFLTQNGDPLGEKLVSDMKTTGEFVGWTIKPNGIVAQVGDTVNIPGRLYGPTNKMRRHTPQEHKFYPLSGYYFYRSNRGDEAKCDTWKLLKSGYVQMTHKHADDCSFMLYSKGYEIFVDCGMYAYTKDAFRAYFTSALAHNTVIVDGATYPCDKNHTHCAGMRGYHAFPGYDHVRVFNDAYNGVKFQRDFCSADDLTLIVGTLESRSKHTYSQLFHLGEQMELIKAGDREVVIRLADSGYRVRLRQYGGPVKLELIRGDKDKPGLGLISRGTAHVDAITTLKFNLTGTSGVFATAITIEDENGLVRLGDVKAPAEALRYDAAGKTFTLGALTIPFHDMLPEDAVATCQGGRKRPTLTSKCSLSIYGSCVSRDVLTIANDTKFDLKVYIARQSMISAVAPKISEGAIPLENSSAFRKRVVESDLRKNAFELLKANKSDYFMLDLIDERFPLLRLFGSYVTASSEFYESAPKKYRLMDKLEKRLEDGKRKLQVQVGHPHGKN